MERKITVGRESSNDIHVSEAHEGVSRKHANIYYTNGRILFEDISTNGSYVNNNFIHHTKVEIFPNDVIMLGKHYVLSWNTINNALSLPLQRPTDAKEHVFDRPYDSPQAPLPPPPPGVNYDYNNTGRSLERELSSWNWGAFYFGWLWGIFNGVYWPLLVLIPYVGWAAALIVNIVLGIKGNAWAWKGRYWKDINHFKRVQRSWAMWALYVFITLVVISITVFVLFSSVIVSLLNSLY
ncbi:MAG: FHA domain-containing protein [Tannerella sp.]|jgi:hypothetical protein|nr:FHA domain-containing protein [Tannerella sp.]